MKMLDQARAYLASNNLLDRAIAYVSPGWAKTRMRDRTIMALAGGYHGGSRRRPAMAAWNPGGADADSALIPDLQDLRDRSRDLARNNPLARGALNTNVTNVIGTGLTLQSAIDYEFLGLTEEEAEAWQSDTDRRFRQWFESPDCDITRHENGYGLQALAFRSMLESGDVIALTPVVNRSGTGEALTIQLIEADRLSNPNHKADTDSLVAGVEMDEHGAPVTYHICNQHPGSLRLKATGKAWTPVSAFGASTGRRNVLHVFERRRPGQSRGEPYLAAVMEPLKQLGRYTDAEIAAAVNSAALVVFTKIDPKVFDELFAGNEDLVKAYSGDKGWDGTIPTDLDGPGKAINLVPGEDISVPNLGRPNDKFDPFVLACLRQVGVALELPFEVLIKHFTASYSAARAALLDAWRFFRSRREFMATYFCQPIYEEWLAWEIANGRIVAPGFFADGMTGKMRRAAWCGSVWIGDGPGSIDPLKEVLAAKERVDLEISTLAAESVLHDGVDWEVKHRQRAREIRKQTADGTRLEVPPAVTQAALDNVYKEAMESSD